MVVALSVCVKSHKETETDLTAIMVVALSVCVTLLRLNDSHHGGGPLCLCDVTKRQTDLTANGGGPLCLCDSHKETETDLTAIIVVALSELSQSEYLSHKVTLLAGHIVHHWSICLCLSVSFRLYLCLCLSEVIQRDCSLLSLLSLSPDSHHGGGPLCLCEVTQRD